MESPSFQWGPDVPNDQPEHDAQADLWIERFFDFDGWDQEHNQVGHSVPTAKSTISSSPPPPGMISYPLPDLRVGEQAPTTMDASLLKTPEADMFIKPDVAGAAPFADDSVKGLGYIANDDSLNNNNFLYEDSLFDDPFRLYHVWHTQNSPIGQSVPEVEGIARAPMPHAGFPVPDAVLASHPTGAVSHVFDVNGYRNKCFRCLVRGIQCVDDPEHKPACKRCSKDYSGWPQACIRRDLATIATDSARDRCMSQAPPLSCASPKANASSVAFLGNYLSEWAVSEVLISYSIELSFSSGKAHKPLKLTLQEHLSGTEKTLVLGRYDLLPKDMVEWSEQMMDDNDRESFEVAIEDFIKRYSQPVRTAMQEPNGELKRPLVSRHLENAKSVVYRLTHGAPRQTELLNKVHSLKAMCRIIRCDEYTIVKSNGVPTSQPLAPGPKAELRSIACSTLETVESDILAELDRCLRSKIDADQGKLKTGQESRPALWATFWQLIFVYDHLLDCSHNDDLEFLLKAVALFYSAVFYIKGSLRMTPQDFNSTDQTEVGRAFKHAMSLRKSYCKFPLPTVTSPTPDADGCGPSPSSKGR